MLDRWPRDSPEPLNTLPEPLRRCVVRLTKSANHPSLPFRHFSPSRPPLPIPLVTLETSLHLPHSRVQVFPPVEDVKWQKKQHDISSDAGI